MIMRSWIVNDACGNRTIAPQILTVVDTRPPVFQNIPNDVTISCEEAVPGIPVVTATDNCTDVVMVQMVADTIGDECFRQITRTWSSTDDCGNLGIVSQVITIVDTLGPFFIFEPNPQFSIECDQIIPDDAPIFGDNCDPDFTVVMTEDSIAMDCGFEIIRSWTATDRCGNATNFTQTIFGVDTRNPCLLYTSPSPRDATLSRMPSSA